MMIKLLSTEVIAFDLGKQILGCFHDHQLGKLLIFNNSIINPSVQSFCLPLLTETIITQTRSTCLWSHRRQHTCCSGSPYWSLFRCPSPPLPSLFWKTNLCWNTLLLRNQRRNVAAETGLKNYCTEKHREIYLAGISPISIVWTSRAWRSRMSVYMKKTLTPSLRANDNTILIHLI